MAIARPFRPPAQTTGGATGLTANQKIAARVFQQNLMFRRDPFAFSGALRPWLSRTGAVSWMSRNVVCPDATPMPFRETTRIL